MTRSRYVWVLCVLAFNVRLTGIAADVDDWNEYMAGEAKRRGVVEYTEERLQGTSVQRLGLVINLIMLLTGLVVAVLAAFILAMYAEAFSNIATCLLLIGLSMVVTSIFLMYGAVTATTAVMKAGNIVLLLISMLFLFLAIMTSMASGNVDDLHKTVKDDWPKMQAKLTHEDPLYCSGQTEAQCKDKFMDEVTANVSTLFGVLFVMLLYEAVMIVITNSVTVSMFHGSGGSLKDKVMGMTQHERKLPQSERIKMMKNRVKPLPMTIEQTEAAVISEEEDDPDADPEDEEAADLLHKGDEQLHTGDLKGALDLYVQAQLIEPGNVKLRSRVRNARRQLAVEMDFQMQVALYDDTEIAEDEAAVKMQAAARGRIEKNRLNKQKEAAIKIQRVQRGKAARAKNASE
jgi:ABC-type multidrug transport system fused ATPase/permease subunit